MPLTGSSCAIFSCGRMTSAKLTEQYVVDVVTQLITVEFLRWLFVGGIIIIQTLEKFAHE